jgi:hypothetical protein
VLAGLAAAGLLLAAHLRDRSRREQAAFARARSQAAEAGRQIDRAFREARELADAIVRDLSDGTLPYADVERRMRAEFASRPDLDGIAITFEPFVYDPARRLYQEYVSKQPDGTLGVLKGATYDYTVPPGNDPKAPKTAWYHTPRAAGPTWNEPFLASGAGKYLVEYGAPFRRRDPPGQTAGVVTVDFSLQDVRNLIGRLDLGATGYGTVFTARGTYLAHPDPRLVASGSVFDSRPGADDSACLAAARRAVAGESVGLDYTDPLTRQDGWVLFEPIPSTGWVLGLVLRKSEYAQPAEERARRVVGIALAVAAALVFLVGLAGRADRGTIRSLWFAVTGFSLISTGLTVLVWYLAWDVRPSRGVEVAGPAAAERYLEVYRQSLRRAEPVHVVQTGVQLTAIKFPDPSTVTVAGYVWQRYPGSVPEAVARGLVFPQQIDDPGVVVEAQRVKQGSEEVIVWSVVVTLQQTFDPGRFPFDRRDITVRLEPAELEANVVLVPDFGAYPLLTPQSLPGVSPDIRVSNWQFRGSFFSYRMTPTGANLGLPARADRAQTPALQLVVEAQRNFLGPFIAYLSPAVVAAALAFALLLSGGRVDAWQDLITGLSYVAALFFVIVVAHASLRENVAAVGITYLEHLYILLYVVIALVVLNLFLQARRPDLWVIRFRENLIPKLAYWPVLTAALLTSTLVVFVYG